MSRVVTLDLDDISGVERLWEEMSRVHAVRQLDPELRRDLEVAIVRALADGRIDEERAAEYRDALDRVHPAIVLEEGLRDLVPDRPTIGHFRRRSTCSGSR